MNKGMKQLYRYMLQVMLLVIGIGLSAAHAAQEGESNKLENIDFRVDNKQNAQIIVQLANPRVAVDVQKAQEGLSIELLNTDVPDEKIYLLDVKDFCN